MATEVQETDKTFNQKFKLADNYLPPLSEGKYHVTFTQRFTKGDSYFENTKDFCVALNTEILAETEVFSVYPLREQIGDFSTELPFIVLNNQAYPWLKEVYTEDNIRIPWSALIVVSEKEIIDEKTVPYNDLGNIQEDRVYFPYKENEILPCKSTDNIHVITITMDTFKAIMPSPKDRYWLTHCKKIDLSDAEDKTAQNDGYFSVIIANRFPPNSKEQIITSKSKDNITDKITNTVHLIAAYCYDDFFGTSFDSQKYDFVKLISLYHWKIYSDTAVADKTFEPLIEELDKGSVHKQTLKPHFLRTGEKTYSLYHSPIQPINFDRAQSLNGENNYTSDRRLIYYKDQGIFDVSYAAAFNLGRIVTLSHNAEAQQIVNWRKKQKTKDYIEALKDGIKIDNDGLKTVVKKLNKEKLK